MPMIQSTDHKELNKKKSPSEDASIPLRRGKKIIMGGRGKDRLGWEREKKRNRIRYGLGTGEKPREQAE